MNRMYTVSQDSKSGLWYAHMKGLSYIPIFGSFCENKSDAMEYAKMYNGFPHRVSEIEKRWKRKLEEYKGDNSK